MGAHAFEKILEANARGDVWETAALYQLVHGLALWLNERSARPSRVAAWSFVIGVLIFSGSLYVLALTNIRWLGAITPIGGTAFLVGWIALIFQRQKRSE